MGKKDRVISLNEVYESISDRFIKNMTEKIIQLFLEKGLSYKIKIGYKNAFRIFCYIKKSKETLIINPVGKNSGPFELQIRIKNRKTLEKLESLSPNVRSIILNSKDCKTPFCCNCGFQYQFSYHGQSYQKCHMLCDNFTFSHLKKEDTDSIMRIIEDEIDFDSPRAKQK